MVLEVVLWLTRLLPKLIVSIAVSGIPLKEMETWTAPQSRVSW
jgi:hypothetical protein